MHRVRPRSTVCLLWLLLAAAAPVPSAAQEVLDLVEELDFDRPEAWAMKTFSAVSLLTGLGAVETRRPGSVEVGFEVISVPHFDQEERTVGFMGFKEEDLNRSPVWGRLRATFGLPAGFAATVGWVPPVEIDGVEANLVSASLERALYRGGPWGVGLRLFGQVGDAGADFTCGEAESRFEPGSPENPFGCQGASSDEVTLEYLGAELVGSYRGRGHRSPTLHLGLAASRLDLEFQVDALTFGFRDRTKLLAEGTIYSAAAGATWALGSASHLGVEVFYAPLDVQRVGEATSDDEPLVNARLLLRFGLR